MTHLNLEKVDTDVSMSMAHLTVEWVDPEVVGYDSPECRVDRHSC
jgi:hypothetical protein